MADRGSSGSTIPLCERGLVVPVTRQTRWTEKQGHMKCDIVDKKKKKKYGNDVLCAVLCGLI